MNDDQLLRYSRHILLSQIGVEGQHRLRNAHAVVIGVGGLGSPAAIYLASAGVGVITLCDGDAVDLTNLQRQIVHRSDAVGMRKVESAYRTLVALNPDIEIRTIDKRFDAVDLMQIARTADIVLDCSDNFSTRHAINRACVAQRRLLVSAAAVQFEGHLAVFDRREPMAPCYACLFAEDGESEEIPCAVMGVFAPLTGVLGSLQAAEALKLLIGIEGGLTSRLLRLNALTMKIHTARIVRDHECTVCGSALRTSEQGIGSNNA